MTRGRSSRPVDQAARRRRHAASAGRAPPRSRRRRLHRSHRRGAGDVDRARHAIQISYPDQVSWLTVAERFRSWIVAGLWLIATAAFCWPAAHVPPAARRRRAELEPCRFRPPIARSAIFWSAAASSRFPSSTRRSRWPKPGTCGSATRCCRATGSSRRLYYETFAQHFDLPFVDLVSEPPDPALLPPSDADIYARAPDHAVAAPRRPHVRGDRRARPGNLLFARQRWGTAIEFVVASKFDIIFAIQTAFADALSHRAVFELAELDPDMSAQHGVHDRAGGRRLCAAERVAGRTRVRADRDAHRRSTSRWSLFYLGNFIFKGILVSVGGGRSADDRPDDRDRGAGAARRRTAGIHRAGSDVPRGRRCCRGWHRHCANSTIRSASSTSRSCSKPATARPSRPRARSASKACSRSFWCRRQSRRPSRRPAISRCASRAANIW